MLTLIIPTYMVSCNKIHNNELGEYITYGIVAYHNNNISVIADVTCDCSHALQICDILLSNDVSILHFQEVVEDLICA